MPYTTEFTDGGHGVLHVGSGIVTGAEILAGAVADHAAPGRADRLTHGIADLSAVELLQLSSDDVRRIAEENLTTARIAPAARVAVVAVQDHIFGMARMWQVFADGTGWDTRVFRSRAEADAWLRESAASGAKR